jgi:hypothetical protein
LRLSLGILASPIADREGPDKAEIFWQVAKRLDQLEMELPTYRGSLHTALVCGTPPVTPNITFEWELVPSGSAPMVLRIRIFSAKVRDISGLYSDCPTAARGCGLANIVPPHARPEAGGSKRAATTSQDFSVPCPASIPTASYVQRVLRKGGWQAVLIEGTRCSTLRSESAPGRR